MLDAFWWLLVTLKSKNIKILWKNITLADAPTLSKNPNRASSSQFMTSTKPTHSPTKLFNPACHQVAYFIILKYWLIFCWKYSRSLSFITKSRLIIRPYPLFYEGHRFLFNSFIAQQWISYCGEEKTAFAEVCVVECGSLSRNGGGDVIKWLNVSNS